jgi:hypothetical protein
VLPLLDRLKLVEIDGHGALRTGSRDLPGARREWDPSRSCAHPPRLALAATPNTACRVARPAYAPELSQGPGPWLATISAHLRD